MKQFGFLASGFTGWSVDNFVANSWSKTVMDTHGLVCLVFSSRQSRVCYQALTWVEIFVHHRQTFQMGLWPLLAHRKLSASNFEDIFITINDIIIAISIHHFRTFLYLIFVLFLGSTCDRDSLLTDYQIAVKVSAVEFLLLAGVYVSSISSCLGAMYGTPR